MPKPKTYTIYAPGSNEPIEKDVYANARDMVNGAGYSWSPNGPSLPTERSPVKPVEDKTDIAQKILDGVGGTNDSMSADADTDGGDEDGNEDDTSADEETSAPAAAEAPAEKPAASSDKPARRTRRTK